MVNELSFGDFLHYFPYVREGKQAMNDDGLPQCFFVREPLLSCIEWMSVGQRIQFPSIMTSRNL